MVLSSTSIYFSLAVSPVTDQTAMICMRLMNKTAHWSNRETGIRAVVIPAQTMKKIQN